MLSVGASVIGVINQQAASVDMPHRHPGCSSGVSAGNDRRSMPIDSSTPVSQARQLDHAQLAACSTNPRRTGLLWTYSPTSHIVLARG